MGYLFIQEVVATQQKAKGQATWEAQGKHQQGTVKVEAGSATGSKAKTPVLTEERKGVDGAEERPENAQARCT